MKAETTQDVAQAPAKAKPGESWKVGEQHVLPKNNIPVVFAGLMMTIFLAALDQVRDVLLFQMENNIMLMLFRPSSRRRSQR